MEVGFQELNRFQDRIMIAGTVFLVCQILRIFNVNFYNILLFSKCYQKMSCNWSFVSQNPSKVIYCWGQLQMIICQSRLRCCFMVRRSLREADYDVAACFGELSGERLRWRQPPGFWGFGSNLNFTRMCKFPPQFGTGGWIGKFYEYWGGRGVWWCYLARDSLIWFSGS